MMVRRFFDEEFSRAVPLMPIAAEDFRENPTGSLVTIRCAPVVLQRQGSRSSATLPRCRAV